MFITTEEFLAKLNKISFNEEREKGNGFTSKDGWEVRYSTKLHGAVDRGRGFPSIQMVVHVLYNGVRAATWGCTEDDQDEFIDWFLKKENQIRESRIGDNKGSSLFRDL